MKLHEILNESYLRRGAPGTRRPQKIPGSEGHEVSHCLRKRGYPTLKQAREALLQCWRRGRKERSFYPCDYCGKFHLTSQKPGGISQT